MLKSLLLVMITIVLPTIGTAAFAQDAQTEADLVGEKVEVAVEATELDILALDWTNPDWLKIVTVEIDQVETLADQTIFSKVSWGLGKNLKTNFDNISAAREELMSARKLIRKNGSASVNVAQLQNLIWNVGYDASAAKGKLAALSTRALGKVSPELMQELDVALDDLIALGKTTAKELDI